MISLMIISVHRIVLTWACFFSKTKVSDTHLSIRFCSINNLIATLWLRLCFWFVLSFHYYQSPAYKCCWRFHSLRIMKIVLSRLLIFEIDCWCLYLLCTVDYCLLVLLIDCYLLWLLVQTYYFSSTFIVITSYVFHYYVKQ